MPKAVIFIECGYVKPGERGGCKGQLNYLCHTTGYAPNTCGSEPPECSHFLVCNECGRLFYTHGGMEFSFADPGKLIHYEGLLTTNEIRDHAQVIRGRFHQGPNGEPSYEERRILLKSRPMHWSERCVVKRYPGRGVIELPVELADYTVEIKVVKAPSNVKVPETTC